MRSRLGFFAFAVALVVAAQIRALAAEPVRLLFIPHGEFFSKITHQTTLLDPQVFVRDDGATAAVGPQGIPHNAGFRNARLSDPIDAHTWNAEGTPLPFTLGQWLEASGNAQIVDTPTGSRVTMRFAHLVPNGVYNVFENHFEDTPVTYTALDGRGTENAFVAKPDGSADVTISASHRLTNMSGLLVIYHSDGKTHGLSRGRLGIDAHHQLVLRIPER